MNYILQKVNCKALIVFVLATVLSIASASIAFAYTMRKIPNFWFVKNLCLLPKMFLLVSLLIPLSLFLMTIWPPLFITAMSIG